MSRPQDGERNQEATCYIGNIDERATDSLIWELMLQAGPIVNVHLPKDRVTSSHQGYGFAEFQTEPDAEYACRIMNGIKLYGKPIRVNKASSDKRQIDIGANLFVGNLDAAVDERLLYETFSVFGSVVGVPKVARDEQTNASRNFAFVSFDSFEASDAALEALNGQYLLNRTINVTYALKKDGKGGERHGTPAERLLAAQARKNNALPPPSRIMLPPPPPPSGGPPLQQQQPGVAIANPNGGTAHSAPPGSYGNAPPPPSDMPLSSSQQPNTHPPAGMPVYAAPSTNGNGGMHPSAPPPPPLPQGFAAAYPHSVPHGMPPPPPPPHAPYGIPNGAQQMYYGPPPGVQNMYSGPPPSPHYMTGSNNAPLGPRHGHG